MRRERLAYLVVALLAAAIAIGLWAKRSEAGLLDRVDRMTLDAQLTWRGPIAPQQPISLLVIDDTSLQGLGGVDRRRIAEAIDKLTQADAKLIALDMLFVEPGSPAADETLARSMARSGRVFMPFALPGESGPAVVPQRAVLDNAFTRWGGEAAVPLVPLTPARILAPRPEFASAAAGMGHVTSARSADGTLRFDLPGLVFDGEAYPSLALRIAAAVRGTPWADVGIDFGSQLSLGKGEAGSTVALDALSRQWINYYGAAGRFDLIRIDDLIRGKVPRDKIAGRIIFAGAVAPGSGDNFPTPFDAGLPGVERLATSVDNLLSGRVLVRPNWAGAAEFAGMLLLPLIAVTLIAAVPLRTAVPLLILLTVLMLGGLQWRFVQEREFIAPIFPLIALVLASAGALIVRNGVERAARLVALLALRASERRYALAAQGANDGLWDWDITGGAVHFSPRWCALMGVDETEAVGMEAWTKPLNPPQRATFEQALQSHLQGRSQQFNHLLEFTQGGQARWLLARGMATVEEGEPTRMAGSLTDVSELHRLQQQVSHDALYDRLTGLGNRSLFRAQLEQLMAASPQGGVGVLLLGMDGMRAFNESHGVIQGDAALIEVGRRLRRIERVAVQAARIGPDEFALAATMRAGEVSLIPELMACFTEPLQLGSLSMRLSAGVGLAHASEGLTTADDLIGAAEAALARAKSQGPGHSHRFDAAEQLVEQSRRWMIEQIDKALIAKGQFQLHYQPFVRLSDRGLLGFEALIRWTHPTKGLIMPGDFIPVAEASGQIADIGRWTLFEAAAQLRRWREIGFHGEIAVNVSGVQLENELQLLADARAVKEALGPVPTHQLKIEVTESMAMSNPQRSAETLQELANMGFKISIDDFGTGYSSLAYLHRFPFDTLKIDRSFVMRLGAGREAQEIVRTIVGLADALGKQTLAEGVEDEKQAAMLLQLGVQVGQGWLWSKALPEAQALAVIRQVPWKKEAAVAVAPAVASQAVAAS